jgi:hypothetical protein
MGRPPDTVPGGRSRRYVFFRHDADGAAGERALALAAAVDRRLEAERA